MTSRPAKTLAMIVATLATLLSPKFVFAEESKAEACNRLADEQNLSGDERESLVADCSKGGAQYFIWCPGGFCPSPKANPTHSN